MMLRSFLICLLIPVCIGVYFVLFQSLQESGFLFAKEVEALESEPEGEQVEKEAPVEQSEQATEKELLEELVAEQLYAESDTRDVALTAKEIEQLSYTEIDGGLLAHFTVRDQSGAIVDERRKTINNARLLPESSDRYFEVLAEEFVRQHYDRAEDFYVNGTLLERDEQYVKVTVEKVEWKANFHKEKFVVLLDVNGGKPKPISMQRAKK